MVSFVRKAILAPERGSHPRGVVRSLLLQPRLFDLASAYLQYRDSRRRSQISDARTGVTDDHFRKVFDYNAGVTLQKDVTTSRRAEVFYQVLALPPRDLTNEKLLIVGPRNVQELFMAYLYGFSWSNIQGIDLYSTNPRIRVMNMEAMEFPDATFDAVCMSNTFGYAKDPFRCLSETARVLKPGGRFAFGANHVPDDKNWPANLLSADDVRGMLQKVSLRAYYEQRFEKVNALGLQQTTINFGVIKALPATKSPAEVAPPSPSA